MRQWLSIDEVAKWFGVTTRTIHNYMTDGLVFYRFGATPMFDERDLEAWVESRRVESLKGAK